MLASVSAPYHCDPYARFTGVIVTDSEEEQADRFMLPARRRWMALMDMLQFLVSGTGWCCCKTMSEWLVEMVLGASSGRFLME
jgi:hypothetical protein